MGRKRKAPPIPFDAVGADVAKLMALKRRLIEHGMECGDVDSVHEMLDGVLCVLRCLLENLEAGMRNGNLEDMTPEQAQQAIYGIRILQGTLADDPELRH